MTSPDEVIAAKLEEISAALSAAEEREPEDGYEAARARALGLLSRLGIDRAMLAMTGQVPDKVTTQRVSCFDPQGKERRLMLALCAEAMGVRAVLWKKSVRVGGHACAVAMLTGFSSDISRCVLLYDSLLRQLAAEMSRVPRAPGETPGKYRRSLTLRFAEASAGAVRASEQRIRLAATRASAAGRGSVPPGLAAALREREQAVSAELSRLYPDLGKDRRPRAGEVTGYTDGGEE